MFSHLILLANAAAGFERSASEKQGKGQCTITIRLKGHNYVGNNKSLRNGTVSKSYIVSSSHDVPQD